MISHEHISQAMNYEDYRQLIETLLAQGKTTGTDQTPDYVEYSKMNLQRMQRIEKTTVLSKELTDALGKIKGQYAWLVLTEGWCGDAAQNIPAMHSIEKACAGIELKLLLRDQHLPLMDQYLTNGSRSIPKLICIEKESLKELFIWGPRPEILQTIVLDLIKNQVPKQERGVIIQKWYNDDKTQSMQAEFLELIRKYMI